MKESEQTEIAVLRNEMKWHKWLILGLYAAVVTTHFIDPSNHWWIFTYP